MEAKAAAILNVVRGAAELLKANREVLAELQHDDRRTWKSVVESMLEVLEPTEASTAVGDATSSYGAPSKRQCDMASRPPAMSTVLRSEDLLLHIMRFVFKVGQCDIRMATSELCRLSFVCRAWRDAAQHEGLWEPHAKALIPRLCDIGRSPATEADLREASGSYRRYILREARLLGRNPVINIIEWETYLVLQVDIFSRRPNLHLFSGEGTMTRDWDNDRSVLILGLNGHAVAPSFSTASIGGDHDTSALVDKFCILSVRVTVRDWKTGRKAVLWNEDAIQMMPLDDGDGFALSSNANIVTTVAFGPASLSPSFSCHLHPELGQEETLPENQKKFVVLEPSLEFHFSDSESDQNTCELAVARFIWSAFQ